MSENFGKYRDTFIRILGYILIPAYYMVPALLYINTDLNYTGMLDRPFFMAGSVLIMAWLIFLLKKLSVPNVKLAVLAVMMVLPLILPYETDSRLIREFHVIAGYALFVYVSMLLVQLFRLYGYEQIYLTVCACAVLYCFVKGEVTYLSESVYGAAVSILMTMCIIRKNRTI